MNYELLIRPGVQDHKVLGDLLAPTSPGARRPIARVVLNAQDVARNEELAALAARHGTPVLVDPQTLLAQTEVADDDPWVTEVEYGMPQAIAADDLGNAFLLEKLIDQAIEFQAGHGATTIIPPYFYAERPDSPAFGASVDAIGRTARRMRKHGLALPIFPVFAGQLKGFVHRPGWQAGLDRFASAALDVGPQGIGLFLSPVGKGHESYAKMLDVMLAARHMASYGVPVIGWRMGAYGDALTAAGLAGYECGMGIGEASDAATYQRQRQPQPPDKKGSNFGAMGTYVPAFGRSLPPKVARLLLDSRPLRGRLVCPDVRCCPRGVDSMMDSKGRPHAVRSRAAKLAALGEIPHPAWRMRHIAQEAATAYVLATKANELLAATDLPNRVPTKGYAAVEQVLEYLRAQDSTGVTEAG